MGRALSLAVRVAEKAVGARGRSSRGRPFGLQIGGSETDVVMLVINERGAAKLLSSQFTLGGEGEVAAGPVGRTAASDTDAKMTANILSWSRAWCLRRYLAAGSNPAAGHGR